MEHTKKSVENTIVGSSSSGSTSAVATAVPLENGQPAPSTNNSAVNISGSQAKTDNSTFIITNESDQSATHKIQVYTLSDSNGDSNEEQTKQATKGGPSGAVSKTESHQHDEEDDDEEDIMVLKEDNNGHGSVAETVGSSDELTGGGGSGPTTATNGPNTAETVVTSISSSSVSVTEASQWKMMMIRSENETGDQMRRWRGNLGFIFSWRAAEAVDDRFCFTKFCLEN